MEQQRLTDKIFYLAIAGFVAGIFVRSFVELGGAFSLFVVLIGGVVFILPFLKGAAHSDESRDLHPPPQEIGTSFRKGGILLAVFILAAGLGMLRYDFAERRSVTSGLEPYVNQTVTLEGVIADEPDIREGNTHLVLRVDRLPPPPFHRGSIEKGVVSTAPPVPSLERWGGRILLFAPHEPAYAYGDRVTVTGKVEHPKNFVDETTLREVDYASYLAKDGIYFQMFRPDITLLASGEGNLLLERLFAFKHAFIANTNRLIPQPHAALLAGLVVGAKQSLGKELLNDFRTVGIIHIVVLSGYNITIVARFIEWLFSGLRRNARLTIAALAMILFALMVGAGATVVRATIMALLVLLAHGTGRLYAVTRALLVAGVIMLLHNPKILVFDISFQLSFLATVGLIYFSPLIEPRVKWITSAWWLREITVATIATQLFVLPFLLYKMGTLSLVSLPVNLLVLIAIPATMLLGFVAGLAGFVWYALAVPFAYGAYALLAYALFVVDWFAKLPFASVAVLNFPAWLAVLWYALYAALLFVLYRKQSTGAFKESLVS